MVTAPIGWILGMRNTMIMNLGEDYIRLAKAKGLPDRTVALKYAARNALLPSVTGFALALGALLGGAILVEQIFDYPGMGRLHGPGDVDNRDYPLMQALLLFMIMAVLIANLVADLLYGVLDPRAGRRPEMTTSVPVPADAGGKRLGTAAWPGGVGAHGRWTGRAATEGQQREFAERPPRWCQIIWSSGKARIGIVIARRSTS